MLFSIYDLGVIGHEILLSEGLKFPLFYLILLFSVLVVVASLITKAWDRFSNIYVDDLE